MNKFKQGDKVSFLNEKLNGVVVTIINDRICKVETQDGFEIDADVSELIKTGEPEKGKQAVYVQSIKETPEEKSTLYFVEVHRDTISLVSAPAEEFKVLTGKINFYLVNSTTYHLQYLVAARTGNEHKLIYSGQLISEAEQLITTVDRNDIFDWENFSIQILLYKKEESFSVRKPVNKDIPILLPDLQTIQPTKNKNDFAKFYTILSIGEMTDPGEVEIKDLVNRFSGEGSKEKPSITEIKNKKYDDAMLAERGILLNEKEVDLHIQELTKEYLHLSNAEIISIQLKKFRKELDQAILNHYHRIIFIHGVGNGKLRHEIQRELRAVPNLSFRDAAFEKYGYGATEVLLR